MIIDVQDLLLMSGEFRWSSLHITQWQRKRSVPSSERNGYFERTENDMCLGFQGHSRCSLFHCFHGILDLIESSLDDRWWIIGRWRRALTYLRTPNAHIMIILITKLEGEHRRLKQEIFAVENGLPSSNSKWSVSVYVREARRKKKQGYNRAEIFLSVFQQTECQLNGWMNHPSQHLLSNRTRRFPEKKDFSLHQKWFEQDNLYISFGKRHRDGLTEGAAHWSAVRWGFCISWWNWVDEVLQERLFGIPRNSLVLVRRCLRDSLFLASIDKKTQPLFTDGEMFDQSELLMPNSVYSANGWVSISSLSLSLFVNNKREKSNLHGLLDSPIGVLQGFNRNVRSIATTSFRSFDQATLLDEDQWISIQDSISILNSLIAWPIRMPGKHQRLFLFEDRWRNISLRDD